MDIAVIVLLVISLLIQLLILRETRKHGEHMKRDQALTRAYVKAILKAASSRNGSVRVRTRSDQTVAQQERIKRGAKPNNPATQGNPARMSTLEQGRHYGDERNAPNN